MNWHRSIFSPSWKSRRKFGTFRWKFAIFYGFFHFSAGNDDPTEILDVTWIIFVFLGIFFNPMENSSCPRNNFPRIFTFRGFVMLHGTHVPRRLLPWRKRIPLSGGNFHATSKFHGNSVEMQEIPWKPHPCTQSTVGRKPSQLPWKFITSLFQIHMLGEKNHRFLISN